MTYAATLSKPGVISQMPCIRNGKKTTLKDYETQGWNAAIAGHTIGQNPYLWSSTCWERWNKGFRAA